MVKTEIICNMCGKVFDQWDEQENRSIHDQFGYGSKYDRDEINLDLCCGCFDELVEEYLIPKCKYNPIVEK